MITTGIIHRLANYGWNTAQRTPAVFPFWKHCLHSSATSLIGRVQKNNDSSWIPLDDIAHRELDTVLEQKEKSLIASIQKHPIDAFRAMRKLPRNHDGDLLYAPFEPVFKRLILHMRPHVKDSCFQEALQLLNAGIPYKQTIRFVFKCLESVDTLFLKHHPHLTSSFHRDNAYRALEPLLKKSGGGRHGPDLLLFPTFQEVNIPFFLKTRSVPIHIVGLNLNGLKPNEIPPFADGFPMSPAEFAWHDIGHIEFMADHDFKYLDQSFKPIERVTEEWDLTRRRLMRFLDSQKSDPNLYSAIELILFEILHERGYQYSLSVLRAQLDIPKWVEILERKKENNYFEHFNEINYSLFRELENARLALLNFIEQTRVKDQRNLLIALHADELSVRITHYPPVTYGRGMCEGIVLDGSSEAYVYLRDSSDHITSVKASGLILAQISPTKETPFDPITCNQIETVLHLKALGRHQIQHIYITPFKEIYVQLTNGNRQPLANFISNVPSFQKYYRRQYFELEQVLGSAERNTPISYTTQNPAKVYLSPIKYDLNSPNIVVIDDPIEHTLPISQILIDPLQKDDFEL